MKEFFGFGGYQRPAEGAYSWQHLTFVTSLMIIMVALAVYFGLKNRTTEEKIKNKVLVVSAFLIDGFEILKIVILCLRGRSISGLLHSLPLFLCSIQLITIPLSAFSKGKIKEASLDFVFIFGILGAILGTYGAAQNYDAYPVLSMDNVVSGITHSISGFCSLYIVISKMASMKKENIWITFLILFGFCLTAYIVNHVIDYNYMFLMRDDGTPYSIFYNLVNGNPILYPLIVVLLFVVYIVIFYYAYFLIVKKKKIKDN